MKERTMTAKPATRVAAALATLAATSVFADGSRELVNQSNNPIASLKSLPLQFNYNQNMGADREGDKYYVNVQPVVPFRLNADWNLISRTILPLAVQHDVLPGAGTQTGLGDTSESLFFSPRLTTESGLSWGAGPVLQLPTATDTLLGSGKWGIGPTAVLLWQRNGWTYGALANHIWSFAGQGNRPSESSTFIQPFLDYTTSGMWTYGLNTESNYDWKQHQWSTPINATVAKLVNLSGQSMSIGGGVRYWADGPESGPHGWGLRLTISFLFPVVQ